MQNRKDFLKNLGIITVGACCGGSLLSLGGCASAPHISGTRTNNILTVKKTDLGENKSIQVSHSSLKAPVFLNKVNENEYTAVLMLCTHKDCELNPAGTILSCPCHGSEFSTEGNVLQGPAQLNLERYKVTTDSENILIQL
jgi:cytochrome b6-f complex iron-sulfur subunit